MLARKFAITAAAAMAIGAPLAGTAPAHASPADCSKLQGLLKAGGVSEGPGWVAQCNASAPTPAPDASPPDGTQIAGAGPPTGNMNDQLFPNYPGYVPPQQPITPIVPQNTPGQQPWEPAQHPGGPRLNPTG